MNKKEIILNKHNQHEKGSREGWAVWDWCWECAWWAEHNHGRQERTQLDLTGDSGEPWCPQGAGSPYPASDLVRVNAKNPSMFYLDKIMKGKEGRWQQRDLASASFLVAQPNTQPSLRLAYPSSCFYRRRQHMWSPKMIPPQGQLEIFLPIAL